MPYDDLKYISERKKHSFLRDEIEEVIKAKNIGRGKFHEYSKQGYGDIISKFYFTFADIKNYPVGRQTLEEYNMHFREELYQEYTLPVHLIMKAMQGIFRLSRRVSLMRTSFF